MHVAVLIVGMLLSLTSMNVSLYAQEAEQEIQMPEQPTEDNVQDVSETHTVVSADAQPIEEVAEEVSVVVAEPQAQVAASQDQVAVQPVAEKKEEIAEKEEVAEQPIPEEEKDLGIDTMDVQGESKGNWLYKRFWWERARKLYEEITNKVSAVFESRMPFFGQRTELDQKLFDPFYQESGYEKGDLAQSLNELINNLEQERKEEGTLSEEERELLAKLEKEKEALGQLRDDTDAIGQLDNAIDDALAKLNEQINLCRNYENQALQKFNEIERELSDKKAKELYHEMRILFENIAIIENYIKTPFSGYFENLGSKSKELIDRVKATIASLKERGLDLDKQFEKMRAQEAKNKQTAQEEKQAHEQESRGWFAALWHTSTQWLAGVWQSITSAVYGAYAWIRGS